MIKYYTIKDKRKNDNDVIYTPDEGFEKGNLFIDEYIPYQNYQPRPVISNTSKDQLLDELMAYSFAMHDLNLFLDVHPDNDELIAQYISFRTEYNRIKEEYEKRYGPINLEAKSLDGTPWKWLDSPWPWEGMHV